VVYHAFESVGKPILLLLFKGSLEPFATKSSSRLDYAELVAIYSRWVCLLLQPVQPGELVKVSQVAPGLPCGWVNLVDGKGVAAAVAIRLAASTSARAEALSVLDAPSNRSIHASEVLEIHLRTSGEAALPSLMKVLRNLLRVCRSPSRLA
jgi:hypothetical protein